MAKLSPPDDASVDGITPAVAAAPAPPRDDAAVLVASQHVVRTLAIGCAELVAIFIVWRLVGWNLPGLMLVHGLALAALALQLRDSMRRGVDSSLPFLGLLGSIAVGPAGAIGAGCLELLVRSAARQRMDARSIGGFAGPGPARSDATADLPAAPFCR